MKPSHVVFKIGKWNLVVTRNRLNFCNKLGTTNAMVEQLPYLSACMIETFAA
jgi:hypothetical protein